MRLLTDWLRLQSNAVNFMTVNFVIVNFVIVNMGGFALCRKFL